MQAANPFPCWLMTMVQFIPILWILSCIWKPQGLNRRSSRQQCCCLPLHAPLCPDDHVPHHGENHIVDIPDNLSGADKDYFIESREARFGKRWRMSVPTATTPCKRSAFSLTRSARQWPAGLCRRGRTGNGRLSAFRRAAAGPGLLTF